MDDYNTEALEATAFIYEGEDPDQAILELRDASEAPGLPLRARVNRQLSISESVMELKNTQIFLTEQNAQLEANIAAATERWQKIQEFMEKLGINLKNIAFVDDIPF